MFVNNFKSFVKMNSIRKTLFFLMFLTFCPVISATTYYVSVGGNDSNAGTINSPWKTWNKGFSASALTGNDTVYFRGGVYPSYATTGRGITSIKSGTAGNLIYYLAYPGEVPILDCSNVTSPTNNLNFGIDASPNYVHIKGLTLRNVSRTMHHAKLEHGILEAVTRPMRCVLSIIVAGAGFWVSEGNNIHFINCDSYNNCDILTSSYPGNDGYGFAVFDWTHSNYNVYFYHCRAWKNGDDGFMTVSNSHVEFDGCWAFCNGQLQGEGQGFKLGWIETVTAGVNQSLT